MKKKFITAALGLLTFAPATLNAQDAAAADETAAENVTTAAVVTVAGDELYKTVTSNFTNTLVGRLSGLIVKEGTGEIGSDDARYLVRGIGSFGIGSWNTAKIFVDGFLRHNICRVFLPPRSKACPYSRMPPRLPSMAKRVPMA